MVEPIENEKIKSATKKAQKNVTKSLFTPTVILGRVTKLPRKGVWMLDYGYGHMGWLLEFYILATSKVISRQVLTCDIAHWSDFIVLPNWDQATSIMS